jgi:hypothetical protein
VYENTTFATSCAYDDPKCYAQCTAMATACGSKWFQWTSRNSYLTFTQSPTSFSTTTITSQSWAYSTSVVHEGEARITFEYASPIGKPLLTTTSVKTFYSMDRKVTRWTEPPPTCTPSAWLKCTKGPDCRACTVQGGTVEVLFWPPASKIASNGTHIAPTQGFPSGSISPHNNISQPIVTAMFGTHTLTSPSVYISFQTAYAINDFPWIPIRFSPCVRVLTISKYRVAAYGLHSTNLPRLITTTSMVLCHPLLILTNPAAWLPVAIQYIPTIIRSLHCRLKLEVWIPHGRVVLWIGAALGILPLHCLKLTLSPHPRSQVR